MSILSDFHYIATLESCNYNMFIKEPTRLYNDIHICHLISGGFSNKPKKAILTKAIKKRYNCTDSIAIIIKDMPLLNTVIGGAKNNIYYKDTKVEYINSAIIFNVKILLETLNIRVLNELKNISIINDFFQWIDINYNGINRDCLSDLIGLQERFYREVYSFKG